MPKSGGGRVVRWIEGAKRHWIVVVPGALIAVIAACFTVIEAIQAGSNWYSNSLTYNSEYRNVEQMDVGLTRVRVEELFGTPTSSREICSAPPISMNCPRNLQDRFIVGVYSQSAYDLRVIYDDDRAVFFSVTSTKEDFKPEILSVFDVEEHRLGEATFADVFPPSPNRYQVFSYAQGIDYWELSFLGGAGDYRTYYLGYSDVGVPTEGFSPELASDLQNASNEGQKLQILEDFRRQARPNTYGFADSDNRDFEELMSVSNSFLWRALPLYEGVRNLY
jgi:hypothetical protein